MKQNKLTSFGPAIIFLLLLIFLWQFLVTYFHVSERVLPAPFTIFQAFIEHWSDILPHAMQTFLETIIGLTVAVILGVLIALLIDVSKTLRNAIYPLLVTSQTIPLIALAPLLLLWFGFDLLPKVIMVILYCFFPIAIATASGLSQTDKELLDLLKSMKASYWQSLRFVRFPSALPSFFSGLKIAVTYSVAGAIVGEYVGAYQGLGIYMQTMAHSYATALVFAGIFVTVLLSLLLFFSVMILEHFLISWNK